MLLNIAIGMFMVVLTTAIHASSMVFIFHTFHHSSPFNRFDTRLNRMAIVGGTVLLLFLASLVEVATWAAAYLAFGAVEGLEPALYFSMVSFTTLGFGDVVLGEEWRLLAAFEAANGIVMFGWTTALVVAVVQRTYGARLESSLHGDNS